MKREAINILLVEDEAAHAEAIRRVFQKTDPNAVVRIAGTLREYRDAMTAHTPDIVLMDLNLPNGRAMDVLTSPAGAGPCPVLIMTSYGNEQVAVEAMKAGALDYVVKSAEAFRDMPRTVERALREWDLIQEGKRAEKERQSLNQQLQQLQKAESLGRMASAVAHHFNNQLLVVIGNIELAMADLPRDTGPVECLAAAMRAARSASEVSTLMLTYLGKASGKQDSLDFSEVCRRSLSLLRADLPKDVALETVFPSRGPFISANAGQIQQILDNLVTNAREAMNDGRGAIHLTIKTVFPSEIPAAHRFPITWQPQDCAYACMEVAETGCGIAERDIDKIFDPFFSTKFTGRGLGLSVVLGIVQAHHGAVTVESEPGRGSVFRVFFPVSTEEAPRQPDPVAIISDIEWAGTTLLVEDERMLRQMTAMMLTRLGFTVLEAKDGVEAVEIFQQYKDKIRCVLCDLTMPRMNGWETLAALRELAPDIPVILASGYDEAQVMEGARPVRPQAFLHKPYLMEDLKAVLMQVIKK